MGQATARAMAGAAALAMLGLPAAGHAAGYLKIPDIAGESEARKDSGDAHLDYLTITLSNMGDEHEIEYDIAAGKAATARPKIAGIDWGAKSKPPRAATGSATGHRQHMPKMMRAAVKWRGCAVGRKFDHVLLGDGEGKEYRLEGVTVTHCYRERVSFTYQKIGG